MTWQGFGQRRVIVDTSAFVALTDRRDGRHALATRIAHRLAVERWRLHTTSHVLAETHALLLNRVGRDAALAATKSIQEAVNISRPTPAEEEAAWRLVEAYSDKDFSFCDALSFVAADRLKTAYAFTFDRNFRQYGLTVLE